MPILISILYDYYMYTAELIFIIYLYTVTKLKL